MTQANTQTDLFNMLPEEILIHISQYLGASDLVALSESIETWRLLLQNEVIWRMKCRQLGRSPSTELVQVSRTPWQDLFLREHNVHRNWRNPNKAAVVEMELDEFEGKVLTAYGDRVMTLSSNQELAAWSSVTGNIIWQRLVPSEDVHVEAIIVAVDHNGGGALAISVETGETLQIWYMEEITKIAVQGYRVVSVNLEGHIELWTLTSKVAINVIGGVSYNVDFLIFNGDVVIAAPSTSIIEVWDLGENELTGSYPNEHTLKSLVFNEEFIFTSCQNHAFIRSWSLADQHRTKYAVFEEDATLHVHNTTLVGLAKNSKVRLWNSKNLICIYNIDVGEHASRISVQSGHLVAFSFDGRLKIWDINSALKSEHTKLDLAEGSTVSSLCSTHTKLIAILKKSNDKLSLLALDLSRTKDQMELQGGVHQ